MTGQEGRFVYVLGEGEVVQKRTVTVGPQVWKGVAPVSGPAAGWTLIPPAEVEEKPQAMPSIVTIESGLTLTDRVIVNGLTKARPGTPVEPQAWELKPPPAEKAK